MSRRVGLDRSIADTPLSLRAAFAPTTHRDTDIVDFERKPRTRLKGGLTARRAYERSASCEPMSRLAAIASNEVHSSYQVDARFARSVVFIDK
ncbi:hypothetical protein [Caballeronia sp. HLA56]